MRKPLHYKFDIGDKVKLKEKESLYNTLGHYKEFSDVKDYEYVISGWGWEETENGITPFYKLEGKDDGYLSCDNRISETNLISVGETHSFDEIPELVSFDGEIIQIGSKVYTHLYKNIYKSDPIVNTDFVFAGYGEVYKIIKFVGKYRSYKDICYKREFLCKREDGEDWLDARKYGEKSYDDPRLIVINVPKDFAQKYVKQYTKENNHYLEPGNYDNFAVTEYLKHIGVYEEVMKLLNEQKPVEKKPKPIRIERKPYSDKKLLSLTKDLTDEEKRRLKELLA